MRADANVRAGFRLLSGHGWVIIEDAIGAGISDFAVEVVLGKIKRKREDPD